MSPNEPLNRRSFGEHPGDMEVTRAWQVMSAIHGYIATHKDKDGNLEIKDDKTGETLPLEFVEIHQPVRHLKKEGEYFACTDFRKPGSQDEYYDIDFWVNQKTGKLEDAQMKDTITGMMLIAAMVLCFAITIAWISIWELDMAASVDPVRSQIYAARIGQSPCLLHSYWWWRSAGCRVI